MANDDSFPFFVCLKHGTIGVLKPYRRKEIGTGLMLGAMQFSIRKSV